MPSQSIDDMALRRKVAKLENAREIERVERMVRDLQATLEKDMEQKMERMQAQVQAQVEKNELQQRMERMQVTLERKDLEQKMEKKDLEQKMEKKDLEQKMEKKDLEQQIKRMNVIMRLENEKRDREADKKEAQAQHQIDQLKWEARFSQMEQQQAARAYNIRQLPNLLQYNADTVLPLVPQEKRVGQLQPAPLQEPRPREEETGPARGPSHSVTLVAAATQPVLPSAALPSAALPSVTAARLQAASASQPVQHQHQSTCNKSTPSRPLQQQVQQQVPQQQHQVTAGPAARAGPVPLPANARTHFFLSHCQGTGGDQTNAIYLELQQLGFSCW
jgi:hypothetical protein